MLAVTDL